MVFVVLSKLHTSNSVVGNGCYGLRAWLLRQNIDLILQGCGHILGSSPIVMIIRHPRVANE